MTYDCRIVLFWYFEYFLESSRYYVFGLFDFPNPHFEPFKTQKISKNKINAKMNRILKIRPHELLSLNRGKPQLTTVKTH